MTWLHQQCSGVDIWRRSGTGARLLLLHGLYGDHRYFAEAAAAEALAGMDLLAVDLPGFGATAPVDEPVLDQMARKVRPLCAGGAQPVFLVAHSMASSIAARLLDPAAGLISLEGNILPPHLKVSDRLKGLDATAFASEFSRLQRMAETVVKWETRVADAERRRDLAQSYQLCSADTVRRVAVAVNDDVRSGVLAGFLSAHILPMLTIYGGASEYGGTQAEMARMFPGMEFACIAAAGHFPMLDAPAQTYDAIGNFVRKVLS